MQKIRGSKDGSNKGRGAMTDITTTTAVAGGREMSQTQLGLTESELWEVLTYFIGRREVGRYKRHWTLYHNKRRLLDIIKVYAISNKGDIMRLMESNRALQQRVEKMSQLDLFRAT